MFSNRVRTSSTLLATMSWLRASFLLNFSAMLWSRKASNAS